MTTWSKPEKHHGVELVDEGNADGRQHDKEKDVTEDEVSGEQAKLGNLAEIFSARLRHRMPAHGIPLSCPPCDVRGVLPEFTRECQTDNQLEDEALQSDDSDHSQKGLREVPAFKEEHDFPERQKHDDGNTMSDGCED